MRQHCVNPGVNLSCYSYRYVLGVRSCGLGVSNVTEVSTQHRMQNAYLKDVVTKTRAATLSGCTVSWVGVRCACS